MICFFNDNNVKFYALQCAGRFSDHENAILSWLLGGATPVETTEAEGWFVGPRREMITPWSTNAVEITQNMGLEGITRIEIFERVQSPDVAYDKMLQHKYHGLDQEIYTIHHQPEPIRYIENISEYNQQEGLALSEEEIDYLKNLSQKIGRKLTDSEVFGFSQVNSEHCRHKIFNGLFIIDGEEMPESLFQMIRKTSREHPNRIVSAYKDNVAFVKGPVIRQFAPYRHDIADFFTVKEIPSVISLKAETHNFPTTVEPFNGAATGSGGEIRDRMAGGTGSIPLVGTAVYMTSYPRLEASRKWEFAQPPRPWLYQTPEEILIKASNGASDFGNKFGQPLICGSLLTFEHSQNQKTWGYDKVIMLAGGVGYAHSADSQKHEPSPGDRVVVMGGDNYRIGMGGGAVSSVATGEYGNQIELNAVQRSNPEMQKRVYNAIRALTEEENNPIISIHDHGAGGHLNSLSELVEARGGHININKLPVGDPTLSAKEIAGNESQERMGLVISKENLPLLQRIAERERAPMYDAGEITNDARLIFKNEINGEKPIDLKLEDLFGNPPRTILRDSREIESHRALQYFNNRLNEYLEQVIQLEAVACKDWLTNKVDRSVTGRVAMQQTAGSVQLPLNNLGIVALDYDGVKGIATSIGHAPAAGLIDPEKASRLAVAEALTNIIWVPVADGLKGISLSANWMWPAKQKGEDARLYQAVKSLSEFSMALGINVPTGKDSLSMTQKYPDGNVVYAPGTVIVSAVGEAEDLKKAVSPVLRDVKESYILYIDLSKDEYHLGGSSLAQSINQLGTCAPDIRDAAYFARAFEAIQHLLRSQTIEAGHDISSGGMITALLEMCFAHPTLGLDIDLTGIGEEDIIKLLFAENPGLLLQVTQLEAVAEMLRDFGIQYYIIGKPITERTLHLKSGTYQGQFMIDPLRDLWFRTSYLLDRKQCGEEHALERYQNYKRQVLQYQFGENFTGKAADFDIPAIPHQQRGPVAAIIREKGVNGDREMAYSLYYAGFEVKDVHMTDLVSGRETLEDVQMIVFVGGFSNSDVLGSAKGWAGAFLYNEKARTALEKFFAREDTLSLGICNGCQLMIELGLIYPDHQEKPRMLHNKSGKFESGFINVTIPKNQSVMFGSMEGQRLGVWVAHGEGRFYLPYEKDKYRVAASYSYAAYPGNPNGSDYCTAALVSDNGRHLAMMPHIERSLFPWQWAHYPEFRTKDEVSPWIEAFVNARNWVLQHAKK